MNSEIKPTQHCKAIILQLKIVLLNHLPLHHLTHSQPLTLHHCLLLKLSNFLALVGSPPTSLAVPSQPPGLAPLSQATHYLLLFPRISSLSIVPHSRLQSEFLVDHEPLSWVVNFVSMCE